MNLQCNSSNKGEEKSKKKAQTSSLLTTSTVHFNNGQVLQLVRTNNISSPDTHTHKANKRPTTAPEMKREKEKKVSHL